MTEQSGSVGSEGRGSGRRDPAPAVDRPRGCGCLRRGSGGLWKERGLGEEHVEIPARKHTPVGAKGAGAGSVLRGVNPRSLGPAEPTSGGAVALEQGGGSGSPQGTHPQESLLGAQSSSVTCCREAIFLGPRAQTVLEERGRRGPRPGGALAALHCKAAWDGGAWRPNAPRLRVQSLVRVRARISP